MTERDRQYHYFNSIWDNDPSWIATDQMNNNTGYTETTTGIYDFLEANPEKIQEEAVNPPTTPVATQASDNSIGISNESAYDEEYSNTTSSAYQSTYFTSEEYTMYIYDADNAVDGQFLFGGGKALNGTFDNLPAGDYVIMVYGYWGNGLSSVSNTITITDLDTTPPIAICQDIDVDLDVNGSATITAEMIDNGSYDDEGGVTLSVNPTNVDCNDLGNITATLTVTDEAGNVSTCTATVTVSDNLDPNANTQNIVAELDADGNATITASQINSNSTDNCGIDQMSVSPDSFSCSDLGINGVVFTVTDGSGNSDSEPAEVDVQDNLNPEAIGKNLTLNINNGAVTITAEQVNNGSSDNCSIDDMTLSKYTFDTEGVFNVDFTVFDGSGNSKVTVVKITVVNSGDTTPPIANCKNAEAELDENGKAEITPEMIDNGSYDDEGGVTLSVNPISVNCDDLGNITATLTVTDEAGNVSTCTSTLTVLDLLNPEAIGQNITVDLKYGDPYIVYPKDVDNGSNDNCSFTLTLEPNTFDKTGTYPAELTATDESGNSDVANIEIKVVNSVGVGESKELAGFKIYPNPTRNLINIETGESVKEVVIYNSIGQEVIQKKFSNGTNPNSDRITIDISTLPKGLYFLYTTSKEGNVSTAKVIKN